MNNDMIALIASSFALVITVHLAVRTVLNRRSNSDLDHDSSSDDLYNPYDLSDLPLSAYESNNIALVQRLSPLAQLLKPTNQAELNELRQRLGHAGLRRPETLELFNAVRAGILLLGVLVIVIMATLKTMNQNMLFYDVLIFAGAYYVPMLWLQSRIKTRQEAITRSLPAMLDLLVTCMEAGLNLEGALDRVSKEMEASDPELSEEMRVILHELDAGLSVSVSFKKFANRMVSNDLKNLSNVIIQSVTLGSSLGRALREYAATARRRREFKLEEDAGKVASKLTLPLTICLLPSSMIAMLAPAIVTISSALGK